MNKFYYKKSILLIKLIRIFGV